jgi:hypothetical protein
VTPGGLPKIQMGIGLASVSRSFFLALGTTGRSASDRVEATAPDEAALPEMVRKKAQGTPLPAGNSITEGGCTNEPCVRATTSIERPFSSIRIGCYASIS